MLVRLAPVPVNESVRMVDTEAGIVRDTKLEQFANAEYSINPTVFGIVTLDKLAQLLNVLMLMVDTFGITIDVNPEPQNAPVPIVVAKVGILTVVKLLQL